MNTYKVREGVDASVDTDNFETLCNAIGARLPNVTDGIIMPRDPLPEDDTVTWKAYSTEERIFWIPVNCTKPIVVSPSTEKEGTWYLWDDGIIIGGGGNLGDCLYDANKYIHEQKYYVLRLGDAC